MPLVVARSTLVIHRFGTLTPGEQIMAVQVFVKAVFFDGDACITQINIAVVKGRFRSSEGGDGTQQAREQNFLHEVSFLNCQSYCDLQTTG